MSSVTAPQTQQRIAPANGRGGADGAAARTGGVPPRRDLVARVTRPAVLARILLLTAAFAVLFRHWLVRQHGHSWGNGDWSHAYFVPLISLYLLWQNREGVERTPTRTFWPGLIPMLTGIGLYVLFLVTPLANHWIQGLSMVLTLFGLVLLLTGPRMMEWAFFPLGYLVFGITVPEKVMILLTFPLQQLAAVGAYVSLDAIGIDVDRAGNTLTVFSGKGESFPLNVAEQCSGMRMVIAFVALGAAVALLSTRLWWKRVVLVALATPIALLLNIARVAVLGAATLWNPELASGEAHTFIGTLLLLPGLLLYMLVAMALNKAVPEGGEDGAAPPGPVSGKAVPA